MTVKQKYEELLKSDVFKSWKENHEHSFLSHAFALLEADGSGEWQFGFFDIDNRLMTSFLMADPILTSPETEVFEKPGNEIKELDMKKVKIDFPEAISVATDFQKNNYKDDAPMKRIIILQNVSGRAIWNISFLTQKFNVLNMRIDAETKEVLEHSHNAMMEFVNKAESGQGGHECGCGCGHDHCDSQEEMEESKETKAHPCGEDCKCNKEKSSKKNSKDDYIL